MSKTRKHISEGNFGQGLESIVEPSDLAKTLLIPGSFIREARTASYQEPQKKIENYARAITGEVIRGLAYGVAIYSAIYSATH